MLDNQLHFSVCKELKITRQKSSVSLVLAKYLPLHSQQVNNEGASLLLLAAPVLERPFLDGWCLLQKAWSCVRRADHSSGWLSPGSQLWWVSSRRPPLTCCKLRRPLPGPGLERELGSQTGYFIQTHTRSTPSVTKTHLVFVTENLFGFCTEKIQFWKASDCCSSNKLNRWIGNSIYCLFPQHINMWGASINYGLTANKPTHAKAIE